MLKKLVLVIACAALAACSTTPSREDVEKDRVKAEAIRTKAEEGRLAKQQSDMEAHVSSIPRWAMETPKPDGLGFYAVGMGDSSSLNVAMKKARLEAEFGLAKLYKQEVTGSERSFVQEHNDKSIASQFTSVIDKLVTRVEVVGYEVVEQDAKPIRGTYHAWILLKMPYAQFNKVLHEQRSEVVGQAAKEAFDDLERRVKARQEERSREDRERTASRANDTKQPSTAAEPRKALSTIVAVDITKAPDEQVDKP